MKSAMRAVLGVVTGMAVAFVLVIAVEWFGASVHPLPPGFDPADMPVHVRRFPHWVLGVVVVLWGASAAVSTWVASKIGNRVAGAVVTLLLAAALAFNLAMLPYTLWFKAVMPAVFFVACLLGVRFGSRPRRSADLGGR